MTPVAAVPASRALARVRVGGSLLAVDIDAVEKAVDAPAGGLTPLPRRAGALAGVLQIDADVVPVVSLGRWLDLGSAAPAAGAGSAPKILVLRGPAGRVAVAIDHLHGVEVVPGARLHRIHHEERPDELFDIAVSAKRPGEAPALLLEAGRLMRLADAWCDDGGVARAAAAAGRLADADRAETTRYAVLSIGSGESSRFVAVRCSAVDRLIPTPAPESTLSIGVRRCGITSWQGRKLPMLDLAAILGGTPGLATPWMVVAHHAGQWMGLCVTAARQLVELDADAIRFSADEPVMVGSAVVPGIGTVGVVDLARLAAAAPELVIGGVLDAGRVAAAPAAGPRRGTPYIVFSADREYATPVDAIVGIVALGAEAVAGLARGDAPLVRWRERTVRVVTMPSIDLSSREPPRFALLVRTGADDSDLVGIAVQRLDSWLNAAAANVSRMRVGAAGDMKMITRTDRGRRESVLVVDLAEMAYLLS